MANILRNAVYFWERNVYGAIVVYGVMGVKQYYFYPVKEALKKYRREASEKIFINED